MKVLKYAESKKQTAFMLISIQGYHREHDIPYTKALQNALNLFNELIKTEYEVDLTLYEGNFSEGFASDYVFGINNVLKVLVGEKNDIMILDTLYGEPEFIKVCKINEVINILKKELN